MKPLSHPFQNDARATMSQDSQDHPTRPREPHAVQLYRVRKDYGGAIGVNDLSLSIENGEFVTLLGPSGCGKSTLLGMIAGFITPTAGKIVVGGVDLTDVEPYKRDIGMVFQNYALFPHVVCGSCPAVSSSASRSPAQW